MQSHAAYVASWLEVLRSDKQEIFRAAAQAQKACNYLQEMALKADDRAAMLGGSVKRTLVLPTPDADIELVNQHQPALPARMMGWRS
jgi:hypothetical protein